MAKNLEKFLKHRVTACPDWSTISLEARDRAFGRYIDLELQDVEAPPELISSQAANDLASDMFWEYFENTPQPLETEQIRPDRMVNRMLVDWLKKSPSWDGSRMPCISSAAASVAAAGLMYQALMSNKAVQEALKRQKEIEEAEKDSEEAGNEAEQKEEQGDQEGAAQARKRQKDAKKRSQKAQGAAQEQMDKIDNSNLQKAARARAISKAGERGEDVRSFMTGWGQDPAEVHQESIHDIIDLLKKMTKTDVFSLTRLMGRAKEIGISSKANKSKRGLVVVEDGYTQNLVNIFPSEIAMLRPDSHPLLRAKATGEFADRGLLGMVEGIEEIKSGRLIFAVDESGSMNGDRIVTAKALALGMCQAALENGQSYEVFGFSWQGECPTVNSTQGWQEHLAWCNKFIGGGTDFDSALKLAMEKVEKSGEEASNADIVFITDGEAGVSEDTKKKYLELKKKFGTRLIYLFVGSEGLDDLNKIATTKLNMRDDTDFDTAATKLAEALA